MNIKVPIVDDSAVMRRAVRQLPSEQSGIEIVGKASSLSQKLEMQERFKPEIVIMNLHLIDEGSTRPDGAGSRVVAIRPVVMRIVCRRQRKSEHRLSSTS
jgi:chemotaxis response regulator CheB